MNSRLRKHLLKNMAVTAAAALFGSLLVTVVLVFEISSDEPVSFGNFLANLKIDTLMFGSMITALAGLAGPTTLFCKLLSYGGTRKEICRVVLPIQLLPPLAVLAAAAVMELCAGFPDVSPPVAVTAMAAVCFLSIAMSFSGGTLAAANGMKGYSVFIAFIVIAFIAATMAGIMYVNGLFTLRWLTLPVVAAGALFAAVLAVLFGYLEMKTLKKADVRQWTD